jgi:hypothetical protein
VFADVGRSLSPAYLLKKTHSAIKGGAAAPRRPVPVMRRLCAGSFTRKMYAKIIHESLTISRR